jgi:hypothetical protein
MPKAEVSYSTILRRIRERDPDQAFDALGKRGVANFRQNHSPDISRDYSQLSYNALWTLDDVTEDFYGHNFDHTKLIRPYAYAILRGSTREWICAVACETPIVQDQVRSLLGLAMADPRGGVPEQILFERGTIACDEYLEELLTCLGIRVSRTSMDGGLATPGGFTDRATGHAAGKGIIEAQIRMHHNQQWMAPGSTGPDERHTAQASLETWKAEAIRRAKNGEQLIAPTPDQWQARIFKALADHNNREHGGLPSVLDPESMRTRHMTPAEYGLHLLKTNPGKLRKLDEKCLPLFFARGIEVEINKNGFRLNNFSYGRFDEGLQALVGTRQTVFALPEYPEVAYVEGLGRVVERFDKPAWGEEGDLMGKKRHLEKGVRNQYEAMILRAMSAGSQVTVDSVRFPGRVPAMQIENFATPAILERATRMQLAGAAHGEAQAEMEKRFEVPVPGAEAVRLPASRPGLKERLAEMQEEVGVLT